MAAYEQLKQELLEISKIVESFPESVKPKVYDLLVAQFLGTTSEKDGELDKQGEGVTKANSVPARNMTTATEGKQRRAPGKESYSLDRNLDLRGNGSIPSFKEFHGQKAPKGAKQFNAVAVYYLKKMLGISEVTLDHVYTCYSETKVKPPQAFRQSFNDTKNKEGWIEFDSSGNLEIPHRGVVFVEHDLPTSPIAKP